MWQVLALTGGVVGLAVLVLVVVVALRPAAFRIERSAVVGGTAGAVYGLLEDFRQWGKWSPWEGIDPGMKRTYSGAAAGVGAEYAWAGNKKAGEGKMRILECKAGEKVVIRLEFIKPFAAVNEAVFELVPSGAGTRVTWSMTGRNGFMGKAFGLMANMDKLVGKDFEKGLAKLDAVVRGA